MGGGTQTINYQGNGANTLAAAIVDPSSGSTEVVKAGPGFWVLTNSNSYSRFGTTGSSLQLISFPGTLVTGGSFSTVTGLLSNESLLYTSTALDLLYGNTGGSPVWTSTASGSWATGGNWSTSVSPSAPGVMVLMAEPML